MSGAFGNRNAFVHARVKVAPLSSNAGRGAYYKARTKKWLEARGYQVGDLELVRWVYPPDRDPFPTKKDQFASDLLAVNATEIVFVQVKGGSPKTTGGSFPDAQRKFAAYVFPSFAQCWIVAWPLRSREPRVVKCQP